MFVMEEMKKRSAQSLDGEIREALFKKLEEIMIESYGECYKVPAAENGLSYRLASPCLDAEQNEKVVIVSVSVPRTNRDGVEYDLYDAAADYEMRVKEHEDKEKARAEKKAKEEAEKERKRQERKSKRVAKK